MIKKLSTLLLTVLTVSMFMFTSAAAASAATPEEAKSYIIIDNAAMFNNEETHQIGTSLANAWDKYNIISVVETINTLNGANLETFAEDRANELGIGLPTEDNGLYILIVKNERLVRVATGKGVQKLVPDSEVKTVVDTIMVPQFAKGNYVAGIEDGVTKIGSTYDAALNPNKTINPSGSNSLGVIIFISLIGVVIMLGAWFLFKRKYDRDEGLDFNKVKYMLYAKSLATLLTQKKYSDLTPQQRIDTINEQAVKNNTQNLNLPNNFAEIVLQEYRELLMKNYLAAAGIPFEKTWVYLSNGSFSKELVKDLLDNSSVKDADVELRAAAKPIADGYKEQVKAKHKADKLKTREAKKLVNKLTHSQRKEIKNVSSPGRQRELISRYTGVPSSEVNMLYPYMASFFLIASTSNDSSSSVNSSSRSSSSSSSYDSSSYSSFSGGSFGDGGASGSW